MHDYFLLGTYLGLSSMLNLTSLIEPLFVSAGWNPIPIGRPQPDEVASGHARALEVLNQFGGLHVGQTGPGTEQAASDVHFYALPRPDLSAIIYPWTPEVGVCAAFATAHNDHMILFVNDAGEYFVFTNPDECLYKLAGTFGEAMQTLLWGYRYGLPLARHG
jgi:hypothetical protein